MKLQINLGFLNLCLHNHFVCVHVWDNLFSILLSFKVWLICLNIIPSKYVLEDLYASHNLVMLFVNFSFSPNVYVSLCQKAHFLIYVYVCIYIHTCSVFANVATCVCSVLCNSQKNYILGLKIFKALLLFICVSAVAVLKTT